MNIENSKTTERHGFKLDLTGKLNLKNKNTALANFTPRKTLNQNTTTINLKFLHQLGEILLIYFMVLIPTIISKITLNLSLKNMKH